LNLKVGVGCLPLVLLPLAASFLFVSSGASAQGPGFYPIVIGTNGVLTLDSHDTYYDSSDGTLSQLIALPAGATQFQFRATGGVITDGSNRLASADGLYGDGSTPYNFTATRFAGTYQGTPIGATTGIDPALMGVFFTPGQPGVDSVNYRSDSGIVPDPRTLSTYSPAINQPFWIGDGYDSNNPFSTADDAYIPPGANQTFNVPVGTQYLLLGIGADIRLDDNQNAAGQATAYKVHVFSNVPTPVPEPGSLALLGAGLLPLLRRRKLS
jgi:MYXO-CTERM domain-containing protein